MSAVLADPAPAAYELPEFEFVAPPELGTRGEAIRRYPVVIVGGGLTGLTLACDLATRGIRSVVLDDDNTVGIEHGDATRAGCDDAPALGVDRQRGKGTPNCQRLG